MKSLRFLALMLVVSTFPAFLVQAYGQQEVDPDHFDQTAAKPTASNKVPASHNAAYSHHQGSHVRLASKHSSRAHHHQSRTSA
jgi:hypothetical protein